MIPTSCISLIRIFAPAILTACVCLTACNSMDNPPTDSYLDKEYWTTEARAQYVLNMAYNQMYSARQMYSDEKLSDNLIQGRTFTDERIIRNGNSEPTTWLFDYEWRDLYAGIKTCNVLIANVGLITMPKVRIQHMIAQARFIRAIMYLRLAQFYGDVPYFTVEPTMEEARHMKRTPYKEVMEHIHKELDEVVEHLPSREELRESERGQITKGAAIAMQARAYLYDSDWKNVERYCRMLMDMQDVYGHYGLFGSYSGLFLSDNEYNEEVILDYAYAPKFRTWGEMFEMAPISVGAKVNDCAPTENLVEDYLMTDGRLPADSPLYDENHPYANRDPRLTHTVIYDGYDWSGNINDGTVGKIIYTNPYAADKTDSYSGYNNNQTQTGYYVRKYYDPKHEDHLYSSINIIMIRYADVLLMYAEAMNEQGKMSQEVWDRTVRAIRERAGFTLVSALDYPAIHDKLTMRSTLRRERRSELALEGLRWMDIKRWKAGPEYLNERMRGAKFENKYTRYIQLDVYQFDENKDYLWSVPQSQIDINKNLLPNNPGY